MASPNTSPSAIPPTLTITPPPSSTPSTSSPPPSTSSSSPPSTSPSTSTNSPPPTSQTNGSSDPPASPVTPATPSPPPPNERSAPPPSSSAPPPPSSADPSPTPPAPPPPADPTPPPASSPPPPPLVVSPPPQPPPTPIPPPPIPLPPEASQPPSPSAVSPSPPPPVPSLPPPIVPPPFPPSAPPPPPSVTLPENSPPPPSASPPENAPPPPSVTPPVSPGPRPTSPPPHIPPPRSPSPPTNRPEPSPPPPSNPSTPTSPPPPSNPSTPTSPPPPTNSSGGIPSNPAVPSPGVPSGDPSGGSRDTSPTVPGNFNASSGSHGIGTGGTVAIGAVAGLVVLSLIGLLVWFLRKQKKKKARYNGGYVMPSPFGSSPKSGSSSFTKAHSCAPLVGSGSGSDFILSPSEPGGLGNSRSWFTYEELAKVTNGFSADNLLGEGGFGPVYKGCLSDGREVAVKQLKIGGSQGEREFRAEVEIISRIHHRHLVSLVGYCISENQRLLVYDYLPNNTLYYHLHVRDRPVMDWSTRFKVAAGAARGIAYLHEDCHPRIIHRDIKSSNILLDYNFEARVSDFGLARLALDANTHVSTRVMGTFGYLAPEYASSGKLTEKSDVYSFGVVLLELITGRKPVDESQPLGDESLVEWARPLLGQALDNNGSERFEELVDPRLENNYVDVEMFRMIEVAAACVRHSAVKRPRMGLVVRALDSVGDSSDLSNGMRPGQSEVYDSAQQSAEIRMFRRMAFGSQDYSSDFFIRTNFSRDNSSRAWE